MKETVEKRKPYRSEGMYVADLPSLSSSFSFYYSCHNERPSMIKNEKTRYIHVSHLWLALYFPLTKIR